jgi:two-component system, NarL family, response regulator DegU
LARHRRSSAPDAEPPIRLVVIEPRAILGLGVRDILDQTPDFEVVAYVDTPALAIPFVDETTPDVVLVDVALAETAATGATRRLRQGAPNAAFVLMGRDDDDASIVGAVEMGAVAHVAETAEPSELVDTIRRAADGQEPLKDELAGRPDLTNRIVDAVRDSIFADVEPAIVLTPRELEVLAAVAAGSRNREIADTLGLSEQTVKNHLSAVFHKLGVPNRTRAVMYAGRQGWLDLGVVPDGVPNAG